MKPLCIDLYCGLGGWAEGFLAEGYEVRGYDIEKHDYGTGTYPGYLFIRDVRSLHGAQFKDATVIVASPPCTEPSYRAMPWSRAKALNQIGPPFNFLELFHTCFRIQREASEAAGRYIPLIVENVKGAQPWVGRARWHYGSYYLWGDVPALMPPILPRRNYTAHHDWQPSEAEEGMKTVGHINQRNGHSHTRHLTNQKEHGVKQHGSGPSWFDTGIATTSSKSQTRKAASALIAKIPFPLAQHIASCFKPA